ncbi:SLC13 family permease [Marinoscillum pacificum]|uniref:SLC13 family permease n=1 Tax=Marinoscillum pacificum TaxID=392723 RepID=UPI002158975C|nr:DASS family sodium-coupled anion symporter [Marinoscillum pacificum]
MSLKRILHQSSVVLGPLCFALLLLLRPFPELNDQAFMVLAVTCWVAIWWVTEAIPIPATSFLPIVLFPITGALSIGETTAAYGHKMVFLYIGGFMLAVAIEEWDLHKRIALNLIKTIGVSQRGIVLGFMLATAFLSMWISNTATSVMMLPIGMAIVMQLQSSKSGMADGFGKALMLGVAYSASIGGISTLIGTPPNLVMSGVVEQYYGTELIFSEWFFMVFPISVTLLIITWLYLTRIAFKVSSVRETNQSEINQQLKDLGPISLEEKRILVVFCVTAFLWITRSFIFSKLIPGMDDTTIAIMAGVSLFLINARRQPKIMDWESAVQIPWGIVLLFGGGLAIAEGFKSTGLATWLGSYLSILEGSNVAVILMGVVGSVNFLTEITSNVATTSMILPVIAPLSEAIGVNPLLLMTGATLAASCAFMLPVATPPNAVVFGSGYLKISDMIKTGIVLNIISILLISVYLYFVLPLFWGS